LAYKSIVYTERKDSFLQTAEQLPRVRSAQRGNSYMILSVHSFHIFRIRLEIHRSTWLQQNIYRLWHLGYQMVTWV